MSILKFVLKVYDTKPLSNVILKRVSPKPEECASDAALAEYIKNTCSCVYHPVGTASMLPREDGGVVDHNLKVYGTANVRVVDASILPLVRHSKGDGGSIALNIIAGTWLPHSSHCVRNRREGS